MVFEKQHLDLVLVPSGLILMFVYHLFLLFRCFKRPHTTVIGFENYDKKEWVKKIMEDQQTNVSTALSVLSSSINAAIYLATFALSMSSLIGAWIANNSSIFQSPLIYGDTRQATMSIKFITLLICFLLGFSCFVQSARCFIHTNYLISTPDSDIPVQYVEIAVIRAGNCWTLGLRALYFAATLLPWFFGPIPMFLSSVSMVILLNHLDTNPTLLQEKRFAVKEVAKDVVSEDQIMGTPTAVKYFDA